MSTTVPNAFEDYLRHEGAEPFADGSMCPGCGKHPTAYKLRKPGLNDAAFCECCLRHFHGHDVAEDRLVRGMIGAAVRAALDEGASDALVRAVLQDALDERDRADRDDEVRCRLRAAGMAA